MINDGLSTYYFLPSRKALFNVAQDLSMEDVTAMIQKSKDCLTNFSPAVRQIEKIGKSGKIFEFLNIIQEKKHITSNNVSFLYQLLYDINRGELVHFLEPIKGRSLYIIIYSNSIDNRNQFHLVFSKPSFTFLLYCVDSYTHQFLKMVTQ